MNTNFFSGVRYVHSPRVVPNLTGALVSTGTTEVLKVSTQDIEPSASDRNVPDFSNGRVRKAPEFSERESRVFAIRGGCG